MGSEEKGKAYLEHYGVKGMKWGVRRSAAQLKAAAKERNQSRKDAKAAKEKTRFTSGSKDAPKNLTDEELADRVKRMETEKLYNKLNSRTVSIGEQHATEVMTNIGKKTVQTAGAGLAIYGVSKAIERKFGEDAARFAAKGGAKK